MHLKLSPGAVHFHAYLIFTCSLLVASVNQSIDGLSVSFALNICAVEKQTATNSSSITRSAAVGGERTKDGELKGDIALENSKIASNVQTNECKHPCFQQTWMDVCRQHTCEKCWRFLWLYSQIVYSLPNAIFVIHFSHKIMKSFEKNTENAL